MRGATTALPVESGEGKTMTTKKMLTTATLFAVISGLTFSLAACNPIAAVTEQAVEKAVEDTTGADVDIDAGGGVSMPDDFPSDVPVLDAKLFSSTSIPNGDSKTWTILFQVSDPAKAYADASKKLTDAGYTVGATTESAEGSFGTFDNGTWSVTVTAAPGVSGEKAILSYTVMPTLMP